MNYLFLLLLHSFMFTACSYAQMDKINYVEGEKIKVADQIEIRSSVSSLKSTFGKPDSIVEYFDPIVDEVPTKFYYYKNSYFEVEEETVMSFNLTNELFSVLGLKVGDKENKLSNKFPQSYSNKYLAGENRNQLMVRVGLLTPDGIKSDAYYLVFSLDDKKISSIEYWENP